MGDGCEWRDAVDLNMGAVLPVHGASTRPLRYGLPPLYLPDVLAHNPQPLQTQRCDEALVSAQACGRGERNQRPNTAAGAAHHAYAPLPCVLLHLLRPFLPIPGTPAGVRTPLADRERGASLRRGGHAPHRLCLSLLLAAQWADGVCWAWCCCRCILNPNPLQMVRVRVARGANRSLRRSSQRGAASAGTTTARAPPTGWPAPHKVNERNETSSDEE